MTLWNDGWVFAKMPLFSKYETVREEAFKAVGIPHDALIHQANNLYENFTGWYRKSFYWEKKEGERVRIRFDGVYMDSAVFVNGVQAGEWKYGYSSFEVEIAPFLRTGENVLTVSVCHRAPNSRWYSGAGIYRNVWIKTLPETCIESDSMYFRARQSREDSSIWEIRLDAEILEAKKDTRLFWQIFPKGEERAEERGSQSQPFFFEGELKKTADIPPQDTWKDSAVCRNDSAKLSQKALYRGGGEVISPQLWDVENPARYEWRLLLYEGENLTQTVSATVGFRTTEISPERGFFLNGRRVVLRGVCEHHDLGCFGSAFHPGALRRRFRILKDMGVNAVRTAHNMPDPGFMELADEMGLLVVSEAFDMWELSKTPYDYARFFPAWYKRDVASWIRRDRNHPSLIMWSIGNEIYDTHKDEKGYEWCKKLLFEVARHDPDKNAFTTLGSNYMAWEHAQRCADLVDAVGYNYGERLYKEHHQKHPERVIYGSETGSVVQSRGIYHFPYEASILTDEDFQCSSLGNSSTSWGAKSTEDAIFSDVLYPFSLGQFIWTGFDYIGEPTPYHTRNSYFGQIDTAGFKKDAYYIYQAAWTSSVSSPMVHIFPYWDFNPGQPIDVRVASNGYAVELFLGEKSMGRQVLDREGSGKLCGHWKIPFEELPLHAVAYDRQGREIARDVRHPFSEGVSLAVTCEQEFLLANGEDVAFFEITCLDREGRCVENADNFVQIICEGAGEAVGTDNGDSTDTGEYKSLTRRLFSGKLLFVAKAKTTQGNLRVTLRSSGLIDASITVPVLLAAPREGIGERAWLIESREAESPNAEGSETVSPKGEGSKAESPGRETSSQTLPLRQVRKILLFSHGGSRLTKENPQTLVDAFLFPAYAADRELFWSITDARGIPAGNARITEWKELKESAEAQEEKGLQELREPEESRGLQGKGKRTTGSRVLIQAVSDGECKIRCMSKSGTDAVRIISELPLCVEGFGQSFKNPYTYVHAGYYDLGEGEIGNGNERGIATSRHNRTCIGYRDIDFGQKGATEFFVDVFALTGEPYDIQLYDGLPEEGGEKLGDFVYQKPSVWNTYQRERFVLDKPLRGLKTLVFVLFDKVHIKGFFFREPDRPCLRFSAGECERIYGDSFRREKEAVYEIGNNVTLEFRGIEVGEAGVDTIAVFGRTPLENNSIHVKLLSEEGESHRILEFPGGKKEAHFPFPLSKGRYDISFVFLPGSCFDFYGFELKKSEE